MKNKINTSRRTAEISQKFFGITKGSAFVLPSSLIKKGQHLSIATEFKKGFHPVMEFKKGCIPWNKGKINRFTIKKCLTCGKEFKASRVQLKNGWGKYCSHKCRPAWNKGIPLSSETIKKLSQSHKGKTPWNKNKKLPQYSGKKHPLWKGGRNKIGGGYIVVYIPNHPFARDNYVREHRLVVEKYLGRYLLPTEPVHHLGKKDNNLPQMLMAFISNSAHQKFENNKKVKPEEIIFDGRKL
jgi:uncharacterized protein (DUF1330 family)